MITFLASLVHHMEPNRIVAVMYKRIKKKKVSLCRTKTCGYNTQARKL